MLKKLLSCTMVLAGVSAFAQIEVEAEMVKNYNGLMPVSFDAEAVNDTLIPAFFSNSADTCIPNPRTYSTPSGYITGSNNMGIEEISQLMNLDSMNLEVHSLLVFVTNKEAGANPGSFTAHIYSSTGNISPDNILASSDPVSFANLDTVNTFTTFPFSSPVNVNSEIFFAALDVDNGSDTLSVASSGPKCGGGGTSLFYDAGTSAWVRYPQAFSDNNGDPLDIVLFMFAEVENFGLGLDRMFISRSGLEFYPNPATDLATVKFDLPTEKDFTLVIQNMSGQEVYRTTKSFNGDAQEFNLDISQFNSGAYTYQVIGSKSQLNGVFMKK